MTQGLNPMREEDIRPKAIFDRYLELAANDASAMVSTAEFESGLCFVCGVPGQTKFSKLGFDYAECPTCLSIFANPRPSMAALSEFYAHGESTAYWASDFYRATAEARRQRLWQPKAKKIQELMAARAQPWQWICDIGGGYGIFAEEIAKLTGLRVIVVEPSPVLAACCRERGLEVIESFVEDLEPDALPPGPGVMTSFELFEHLHNPRVFLQKLRQLLGPKSLLVLTTLSSLGLDIKLLGSAAKAVFPPHHLNFANPRAMERLYTELGFKNIEATTPGALDIDILANSAADVQDDFWRSFLLQASPEGRQTMQEALAQSGFSSHMWVVAEA